MVKLIAILGDTKAVSRAINRGNPKTKSPANHEADRVKIGKMARGTIKAPEAPVLIAKPEPAPPPVPTRNDGAYTPPASELFWSRFWAALMERGRRGGSRQVSASRPGSLLTREILAADSGEMLAEPSRHLLVLARIRAQARLWAGRHQIAGNVLERGDVSLPRRRMQG